MSESAEFLVNHSGVIELAAHLARCDDAFIPPLAQRVDIDAYARKLVDNATRFEAWHGMELVGLVAAYCNDPQRRAAFITSVSVQPSWQRRGLAARLMTDCLDHVRRHGFDRIELEVDHRNLAAAALYGKYGFATIRTSGASLIMTLAFGK